MSFLLGRRKTPEQVSVDLLKKLCNDFNNTLPAPERVPITTPTTLQTLRANLADILSHLAKQAFSQQYHYPYQRDQSNPTEKVAATALIAFSEASYNKDDPSASIDSFVNRIIGGNHVLPNQASVDLHQQADSFTSANRPRDNIAHTVPLTNDYDTTGKYDHAIRMDGMFVYANGTMTETNVTATCTAICYVGVSYYVYSEAEEARNDLWKSIVQKANEMLSSPINLHDPPSMPDLSNIMVALRNKLFSTDFGYSYDAQPDDANGTVSRANHLFAIYDKNTSTFEQELHGIIDPMKLPRSMADAIFASVSSQLSTEMDLQPQPVVFWTSYKIDKTHFPTSANDANINENSVVTICNACSPSRSDVSMCFLFFTTVMFEIHPSHEVLERQILDDVFNSANSMLSNPANGPPSPTKDDIDRIIQTLCDQRFQKELGFPYQGKDTQPLDKVPDGGPVYAAKAGLKLENVKPDSAEKFVRGMMSTWTGMPDGIATAIRGDLIREVNNALQTETQGNSWRVRVIPDHTTYPFEDPNHPPLTTKALLIFCNAVASTPAGDHAFTLTWSNAYYIGVYYEVELGGFSKWD